MGYMPRGQAAPDPDQPVMRASDLAAQQQAQPPAPTGPAVPPPAFAPPPPQLKESTVKPYDQTNWLQVGSGAFEEERQAYAQKKALDLRENQRAQIKAQTEQAQKQNMLRDVRNAEFERMAKALGRTAWKNPATGLLEFGETDEAWNYQRELGRQDRLTKQWEDREAERKQAIGEDYTKKRRFYSAAQRDTENKLEAYKSKFGLGADFQPLSGRSQPEESVARPIPDKNLVDAYLKEQAPDQNGWLMPGAGAESEAKRKALLERIEAGDYPEDFQAQMRETASGEWATYDQHQKDVAEFRKLMERREKARQALVDLDATYGSAPPPSLGELMTREAAFERELAAHEQRKANLATAEANSMAGIQQQFQGLIQGATPDQIAAIELQRDTQSFKLMGNAATWRQRLEADAEALELEQREIKRLWELTKPSAEVLPGLETAPTEETPGESDAPLGAASTEEPPAHIRGYDETRGTVTSRGQKLKEPVVPEYADDRVSPDGDFVDPEAAAKYAADQPQTGKDGDRPQAAALQQEIAAFKERAQEDFRKKVREIYDADLRGELTPEQAKAAYEELEKQSPDASEINRKANEALNKAFAAFENGALSEEQLNRIGEIAGTEKPAVEIYREFEAKAKAEQKANKPKPKAPWDGFGTRWAQPGETAAERFFNYASPITAELLKTPAGRTLQGSVLDAKSAWENYQATQAAAAKKVAEQEAPAEHIPGTPKPQAMTSWGMPASLLEKEDWSKDEAKRMVERLSKSVQTRIKAQSDELNPAMVGWTKFQESGEGLAIIRDGKLKWGKFAKEATLADWFGFVAGGTLDSAASMGISIAGGIAGGAAAGPLGAAVGAGAAGGWVEYSSRLSEYMLREAIDQSGAEILRDPEAMVKALEQIITNEELMGKLHREAGIEGLTIGAVEAATAGISHGLAGLILGKGVSKGRVIGAFTAGTPVEMVGGATGEALAYVSTGKDWTTDEALKNIFVEGAIEGSGAVSSVASAYMNIQKISERRAKIAEDLASIGLPEDQAKVIARKMAKAETPEAMQQVMREAAILRDTLDFGPEAAKEMDNFRAAQDPARLAETLETRRRKEAPDMAPFTPKEVADAAAMFQLQTPEGVVPSRAEMALMEGQMELDAQGEPETQEDLAARQLAKARLYREAAQTQADQIYEAIPALRELEAREAAALAAVQDPAADAAAKKAAQETLVNERLMAGALKLGMGADMAALSDVEQTLLKKDLPGQKGAKPTKQLPSGEWVVTTPMLKMLDANLPQMRQKFLGQSEQEITVSYAQRAARVAQLAQTIQQRQQEQEQADEPTPAPAQTEPRGVKVKVPPGLIDALQSRYAPPGAADLDLTDLAAVRQFRKTVKAEAAKRIKNPNTSEEEARFYEALGFQLAQWETNLGEAQARVDLGESDTPAQKSQTETAAPTQPEREDEVARLTQATVEHYQTLNELRGDHDRLVRRLDTEGTLLEIMGGNREKAEEVLRRAIQNDPSLAGATIEEVTAAGTSNRLADGTYLSTIYIDGNPMTVVEEEAETWLKKATDEGTLSWDDVRRFKADMEQATGEETHGDSEPELTEWFSQWVQGYVLHAQQFDPETARRIPKAIREFLEKLVQMVAKLFRYANMIGQAIEQGALTAEYEGWLRTAAGLDTEGVANLQETEAVDQLLVQTFAIKPYRQEIENDPLEKALQRGMDSVGALAPPIKARYTRAKRPIGEDYYQAQRVDDMVSQVIGQSVKTLGSREEWLSNTPYQELDVNRLEQLSEQAVGAKDAAPAGEGGLRPTAKIQPNELEMQVFNSLTGEPKHRWRVARQLTRKVQAGARVLKTQGPRLRKEAGSYDIGTPAAAASSLRKLISKSPIEAAILLQKINRKYKAAEFGRIAKAMGVRNAKTKKAAAEGLMVIIKNPDEALLKREHAVNLIRDAKPATIDAVLKRVGAAYDVNDILAIARTLGVPRGQLKTKTEALKAIRALGRFADVKPEFQKRVDVDPLLQEKAEETVEPQEASLPDVDTVKGAVTRFRSVEGFRNAIKNAGINPAKPITEEQYTALGKELVIWLDKAQESRPAEAKAIAEAMRSLGFQEVGKVGEAVTFEGARHQARDFQEARPLAEEKAQAPADQLFQGDAAVVVEPGWSMPDGVILRKARVARRGDSKGMTFSLSRITPEQDAEYMAAVEAGDMAKAQRLVDAAAKAAGYNMGPVYHWTDSEFDAFEIAHEGAHFGTEQAAWDRARGMAQIGYEIEEDAGEYWVYADAGPNEGDGQGPFQSQAAAKAFIKTQPKRISPLRMHLSLRNAIKLPDLGVWGAWDIIRHLPKNLLSDKTREQIMSADDRYGALRQALLKKGIDGFYYTNEVEDAGSISYIVLNPNQIKSADPVTRDSAGNVIPLSQRFNPADDRITFSLRAAKDAKPGDVFSWVFWPADQQVMGVLPEEFTSVKEAANAAREEGIVGPGDRMLNGGERIRTSTGEEMRVVAHEPGYVTGLEQARRAQYDPSADTTTEPPTRAEQNTIPRRRSSSRWAAEERAVNRALKEADPAKVSAPSLQALREKPMTAREWLPLAKQSSDPTVRQLAAALETADAFSLDVPIEMVPAWVAIDAAAEGGGTIPYARFSIFSEAIEVTDGLATELEVLHEIVHAATARKLNLATPVAGRAYLSLLEKTAAERPGPAGELIRLYVEAVKTALPRRYWNALNDPGKMAGLVGEGPDWYAFSSVDEFVAGLYSSPKFVAHVRQAKPSLWKRMVMAIARLFGWKLPQAGLLERSMDASLRLIQKQRRNPRRAAFRPRDWKAATERYERELAADEERRQGPRATVKGPTFSLKRITPEQDAEYMAAVEAGDMAKAQAMVDAAAKKAGWSTKKLYHGHASNDPRKSFRTFRAPWQKAVGGPYGALGAFFTTSKEEAQEFADKAAKLNNQAPRVESVYLRLQKPAWVDLYDDLRQISRVRTLGMGPETMESGYIDSLALRVKLQAQGADGLVSNSRWLSPEGDGSNYYVVFSPNQIKSADPVTRDSAGNVVPLSQRFNPADDRITFSLAGPKARGFAQAKKKGQVFRGLDGIDRFEIHTGDSAMKIDPRESNGLRKPIDRVLEFPELYQNYPGVRQIVVHVVDDLPPRDMGRFDPGRDILILSNKLSPMKALGVVLHEIQHWIQRFEGFKSQGSSPAIADQRLRATLSALGVDPADMEEAVFAETVWQDYWNNYGEAEARIVQRRANLTRAERAASSPYADLDVDERRLTFSLAGPKAKGFEKAKAEGRVFEGKDGKPRFELDASQARLFQSPEQILKSHDWAVADDDAYPLLGEILYYPEFYSNYPEAANLRVRINPQASPGSASYSPNQFPELELAAEYKQASPVAALLHELQHYIQIQEGFPAGTSVQAELTKLWLKKVRSTGNFGYRAKVDPALLEQARALYATRYGEVEARAVEKRIGLSRDERNARPFDEDLDISADRITFSIRAKQDRKRTPLERMTAAAPVAREAAVVLGVKPGTMRPLLQAAAKEYDGQPGGVPMLFAEKLGQQTGLDRMSFSLKRITPEQDAEYLAAVEAGDMAKAQAMVDVAAKAAGYTVGPVWHGTEGSFDVFDTNRQGPLTGNDLPGSYFAKRKAYAWAVAQRGQVGAYYLKFNKLANDPSIEADARYEPDSQEGPLTKNEHRGDDGRKYLINSRPGFEVRRRIEALGYDGVERRDQEWIVFNPNQIKSADPVTRDSAGKVIPLSQRFNPESDSISFSIRRAGNPWLYQEGRTPWAMRAFQEQMLATFRTQVNGMTDSDLDTPTKAVRQLEYIARAMPPEVKAQLHGFGTMADLKTPAARRKYLLDRINRAADLLEKHNRKELTAEIGETLEKARASLNDKGIKEGRDPDMHDELDQIEAVLLMSPDEVEQAFAQNEAIVAGPMASDPDKAGEVEAAERMLEMLAMYGNLHRKTVRSLGEALENIENVIFTGVSLWRARKAQEAADMAMRRQMAQDAISGGKGRLTSAEVSKLQERRLKRRSLRHYFNGHLSAEWLFNAAVRGDKEYATLQNPVSKEYARLIHEATIAKRLGRQQKAEEMMDTLADIFGVEKKGLFWKVTLAEKIQEYQAEVDTEITRVELVGSKKSTMPMETARDLAGGKVIPGDIHPSTVASVKAALQQHDTEIANLEALIEGMEGEVDTSSNERRKKLQAKLAGMRRREVIEYDEVTNSGQAVKQRISQDQAVYLTMLYRQEELRPVMEFHGWTPEVMEQVEAFLSDEAKQVRDWLSQQYASNYNEINRVYRELYGVNLSRIKHYAPARFVHEQQTEENLLDTSLSAGSSITPGFLRQRIVHRAEPRVENALKLYRQHIETSQHFIHWAKPMRILRKVWSNRETQMLLRHYQGDSLNNLLQKRLQIFADGGVRGSERIELLDMMRGGFTIAALSAKIGIFAKQLTSFPAYAFDIPLPQYVRYMSEFFTHVIDDQGNAVVDPLAAWKNFNRLRQLPFVKARWNEGFDQHVQMVFSKMEANPTRASELIRLSMITGRAGDIIPILTGGYAAWRYGYAQAREKGMSHKEALREAEVNFEMATERAQQSGDLKDQSDLEVGGSAARLFTMFLTSPKQYFNQTYEAVKDAMKGRKDGGKEALRRLLIGHVILPAAFMLATDLFLLLAATGEGDDDKIDELMDPENIAKRYGAAMMLGPLNGLFVLGHALSYVISQTFDQDAYGYQVPVVESVEDAAKIGREFMDLAEEGMTFQGMAELTDHAIRSSAQTQATKLLGPVGQTVAEWSQIYNAGRNIAATFGMDEQLYRAMENPEQRAKREASEQEKDYGKIKKAILELPPAEARAKLQQTLSAGKITPTQRDAILDDINAKARGAQSSASKLSEEERRAKSLGLESGARARWIVERLKGLEGTERTQTIQRWRAEGILTPEVERQVREIQRGSR